MPLPNTFFITVKLNCPLDKYTDEEIKNIYIGHYYVLVRHYSARFQVYNLEKDSRGKVHCHGIYKTSNPRESMGFLETAEPRTGGFHICIRGLRTAQDIEKATAYCFKDSNNGGTVLLPHLKSSMKDIFFKQNDPVIVPYLKHLDEWKLQQYHKVIQSHLNILNYISVDARDGQVLN